MADRHTQATQIVHKYMALSGGAALIPIPLVDVTALAGLHIALIKQLSDLYAVEFSEHTARNIVIAILGSIIPGSVTSLIGNQILLLLSLPTRILSALGLAAFSAVVAYAIGTMFIRHFEAGGTLLDFDLERLHYFVADYVDRGKRYAGIV